MKNAMIAAGAVMLAVLMCSCAGRSSDKSQVSSSALERPTEWSAEQRQLEDITPLEGEEKIFVKRDPEDETIKIIQGVLSEAPINNEKNAIDLIASYSEVMGYIDVYSELRFDSTVKYSDKVEYRFDQYCGDIKVTDGYVKLTVDMTAGNKAVVLNSSYVDTWGLNTKPRVKSSEAVKCAAADYKVDKSAEPQLTVLSGPVLAWAVPVTNGDTDEVYINAQDGDTIQK